MNEPGGSEVSLKDRINEEVKQAMKDKNMAKVETLRFLSAGVKNREIELRPNPLTDQETLAVIKKMVKQRHESIEQFEKAQRKDLVDREKFQLEILMTYLPKALERADLETLVVTVIRETGASSVKDMGKVMKEVQARTAGAADNKMVSEIVKSKLS